MADDPIVQRILTETKPGEDEHRSRVTRYDNAYDIYRASTSTGSLEPWQSKLRVKYGMQVIDTALVNIVSGRPKVVVRPRHPASESGSKAMQDVLDYFIGEDHFVEKQPAFVQQALICGVTVAKNHWLYRTSTRDFRTFRPDVLGNVVPTQERVTVVDRDGPTFEPWNIYDCWWDPNARDVDSAGYVVLRSWLTKDQLLANAQNPETGQGIYRNVEELLKTAAQRQPDSAQQRYLGGSDARRKGMFEILEIWRDDRITVIGNRQILLRDEPNPFWHGKKPVVIAQVMPDGFEMLGISETERLDHLQQALWTVQNMRMDNLHMTVMRGVTYREGGVQDPNSIQLRPRFKWPVMDHDDIRPFEVQPLPPEVYREEQELLGRMQLVTGINPYVSGADTAGIDQNTATGVTALQEVASRLLRFKASQIHNKGYLRTYEQWGDLTQQFLSQNVATKVIGEHGDEQWVEYQPQDVIGHFNYVLEDSEESLSRQQQRGEAVNLLNAFAPLIPLGVVNVKPLLEKVASAYDFPNPEALFQQPQAGPPAAPTPAAGPQNLPGQNPGQLVGGQQMDPRILAAIQGGGR